ncbi:MAG: hypothetical protein COB85_04605 [Bacteroidetes bacterium]|nr:MAG: hypothetical protein COB85_04605 [Bacteroidota bacterium]
MSVGKLLLFLFIPVYSLAQTANKSQILVGGGPEDMVLDTIANKRILISCSERRDENTFDSGIWEYDFSLGKARKLELTFKEDRRFAPHGISLLHADGQSYLFVINHVSKKESEVIRFRITPDTLFEEVSFKNKCISHPNDLYAVGRDHFYFSNDNLFGGSLARYKEGTCTIISKGYSYANGIHVIGKVIYLSTTMGNRVYKLVEREGKTKYKKENLYKISGGDNFTITKRKTLLVTAHPKILKFIKHAKKKENKSPSMVYELDLKEGTSKVVYQD